MVRTDLQKLHHVLTIFIEEGKRQYTASVGHAVAFVLSAVFFTALGSIAAYFVHNPCFLGTGVIGVSLLSGAFKSVYTEGTLKQRVKHYEYLRDLKRWDKTDKQAQEALKVVEETFDEASQKILDSPYALSGARRALKVLKESAE